MPKLRFPWRKKVELKFKWRSGEEGSIELDEYPDSPAMKIREVLGVDDICGEFEWVRIYVDGRLKYTYPCSKKRKEKEEDEIDSALKEFKKEIFKELLEEMRSKRNISAKDILAQMIAEFQMSKDLYNTLKQFYEPHTVSSSSSSVLDRIMEKLLENVVMRAVGASIAPQPQPQSQQVNVEALINMLPDDLRNTIKDVVEKFKQMSPEEQQKLIQEALKEAEKFRGKAES
jgi:DNA-binding Lrp family transcriptional regulator